LQAAAKEANREYRQKNVGSDPEIVTGKKHGLLEILAFSPPAHNEVFQQISCIPFRGTKWVGTGHSLWNGYAHGEDSSSEKQKHFFTANSIVEVGISP
jgi:hypothetical protein